MWVLEKLKDTISLDLSSFIDKTEEEVRPSHHLHHNIITPDKIPEFCLPPRLCKDVPGPQIRADVRDITQKPIVERANAKKPLSAESYGLTGIYERPNTRRKESLFLSKRPVYSFDRSTPPPPPRMAPRAAGPRKSLAPLFGSISSLSETTSSSDSSPLSSPCSQRSALSVPPGSTGLRGAISCPSLAQTLKSSPGPLSLSPPVLFPLDVLQCQEKLQREHVLPLVGRGTVRFSIERTSSTDPLSSLSTVRLRVVSVENTGGSLSCALRVCLMPGRLQRQKSATIRQSRGAVFNEDFFFTELREEELRALQLRIKVVDKAGAGSLRRAALVGVVTKPLGLLLPLKSQ